MANETPTTSIALRDDVARFELAQREAKLLTLSALVPEAYRGNTPAALANCMIAQDIARRTGQGTLAVMQNLHIISGRPSWSSQYIIGALNSCGRFSPLRFRIEKDDKETEVEYGEWTGYKENRRKEVKKTKIRNVTCTAYAIENGTGEILEGPAVSYVLAIKEGWWFKNDSKWQTMPDLMIRYRAAAFFGRLYAPDILFGFHAVEEVRDIVSVEAETIPEKGCSAEQLKDTLANAVKAAPAEPEPEVIDAETEEPPPADNPPPPNPPGENQGNTLF